MDNKNTLTPEQPAAPTPEEAPAQPAPQAAPAQPVPQAAPVQPAPQAAPVQPAPQAAPVQPAPQAAPVQPAPQQYQTQNDVPNELKHWNWGSFALSIYWGVGHKVYLPLLCLIPLFQLVWIFVCGAKGNTWLWETGNYATPQELLKAQESWNRAGIMVFIVSILVTIFSCIFFVFVALNSQPYYVQY